MINFVNVSPLFYKLLVLSRIYDISDVLIRVLHTSSATHRVDQDSLSFQLSKVVDSQRFNGCVCHYAFQNVHKQIVMSTILI